MEQTYLRKIEYAEEIYYLLKYLNKRSGNLSDEYNETIIRDVFNYNYIITGLFHKTKCKECVTNWEVNQVGLLYMHKDRKSLDLLELNIDIEYRDEDSVKKLVREYLDDLLTTGYNEVKIHSLLKSKEYFEDYFNTKLIEYSTFIWRNNV